MPEKRLPLGEAEEDCHPLRGDPPFLPAVPPRCHPRAEGRRSTKTLPWGSTGAPRPTFNYAGGFLATIRMRSRVKRIFRNVNDGLDLIVFMNAVEPHIDLSFFYATGITDGLFESCGAWLTPDGGCEVTTSALEEEAAKEADLPLHVFRTRDENLTLIKARLRGHRRIGINAMELTYHMFSRLRKLAPRNATFVDISEAVVRTRVVKDETEIGLVQKACDVASRAFEDLLPFIRPGVKESDVAAELAYRMQRRGATGPSFRTIVGSGPNGAEPHYTAGPRKLRRGDLVVIDFGAMCDMYCSDITRTVVLGKASDEQRRMYATVARAQAAALRKMRPGGRGNAVDAAARELIDRGPYKGRFIHGLGHSIGLAVHDGDALNPSSTTVLKQNMIFTNEPGVYVPGFGGVRIEDDVLITRSGPRYMTTAPREFFEL